MLLRMRYTPPVAGRWVGLKGLLQLEVVEGLLQCDERAEALDVGRRRLQELGRAVGVADDRHRQLVDERALVLAEDGVITDSDILIDNALQNNFEGPQRTMIDAFRQSAAQA